MQKNNVSILDYVIRNRWLSHILFWLFMLTFYSILLVPSYKNVFNAISHNLIILPPQILASYCLVYFQIPKLFYKKKTFLFFLSFILSSYLFSVMARYMVVHIVEELYRKPPFHQESLLEILIDLKALYKHYFYKVYFPAFLVVIIKLIKEKSEEKNKLDILEKEKISAELNFFKAQIHPHFLFNTLNNLYVLTLKKSDIAAETVLKLSEMLDYMLYQCNDNEVTIEKELQLIQNYIELEELRYGDRLTIIFNKAIDNTQTRISPLILVSFIENAFKHGASGDIKEPLIKIDITVNNKQLKYSVYNTKSQLQQEDKTKYKKGIGVSNAKKQLELLYPNAHHLEITENEQSYKTVLNINLK